MSISPFRPVRIAALLAAAALCGHAAAQPANNLCANAIEVTPGASPIAFTTVGATTDGPGTCATNQDVWYKFTAQVGGTHTLTTCGLATWDTHVSVYSGVTCPPGAQLACNDDACSSLRSQVTFTATAGASYLLRIGGFSTQTGAGSFTISAGGPPPPPPINDACANATNVVEGGQSFDNSNGTTDGPADGTGITNDVWYTYNPTFTGDVTVQTCTGTSFDTALAVYAGSTCTPLGSIVASNNDFCGTGSSVTFPATSGQSFRIRVGGFNGAVGAGILRITNTGAPTQAAGPDVILSNFTAITNWGSVGSIYGYSIGSNTCNIGDTNLLWGNTVNGTPALGMNMYKLKDGRLEQLGLSFVKYSCCAAAGNGCSLSCNGQGGSVLGSGCLDVYSSSYNGGQGLLGPRSTINAFTGTIARQNGTTGDAINRRLQVNSADMSDATALYFVEGVYVGTDDAVAGNARNNCTYRQVSVAAGSFNLTPVGGIFAQIPAIYAWRDHGLGIGVPDTNVTIANVDVPNEGRFVVGARVVPVAGQPGFYDYEYAIMNINSDRSGGSFRVPVPVSATVTNIGFHDVNYHSGEPFDPTDWSGAKVGGEIIFNSPQTFAQNANSNALRWGTMYNFRFRVNQAPRTGNATIGLFKPHTPSSVTVSIPVPAPVTADFNGEGGVTVQDVYDFLAAWSAQAGQSGPGLSADFNLSGGVTVQDIYDFLSAWNDEI